MKTEDKIYIYIVDNGVHRLTIGSQSDEVSNSANSRRKH